jgi:predicted phosphate transport protein (TIGR00153 family)
MPNTLRNILNLFAKSPFRTLNEHAEKVRLTVWKMNEAVTSYVEGNNGNADALFLEISQLEHDADRVKHYIRENLPASLIMPVDRTDILSFLQQQDAVANNAESVGRLLHMKKMQMPQEIGAHILKLNKEVMVTVEEHVAAADSITSMLDSSFSPARVKEVQEIISKVNMQKHNVDLVMLETMKSIYAHEDELGPVGVNYLLELAREMGKVADYAESSSDRLRLMIARR